MDTPTRIEDVETTGAVGTGADGTAARGQAPSRAPRPGVLQTEPSLLDHAKRGDRTAIDTMFSQFLPPGEVVRASDYLGVLGMWGFGTHSFAAVTDRRVASLRVGLLGAVTYQDGGLEHVNSGVIVQPSRWMLYVAATVWLLSLGAVSLVVGSGFSSSGAVTITSVVLVVGGAVLLLPLLVAVHYRLRKCGMVLSVREGVSVYAFSDRKLLRRANQLYRTAQSLRERRLAAMGGAELLGGAARSGHVGGAVPADVPVQRTAGDAERGGPARGVPGIAVVVAGALLVLVGLGLPVAAAAGGDDEVDVPSADAPYSYGDDPSLDSLWDACEAGDGSACNSLYADSPVDSVYEDFGATCGNRFTPTADCTQYDLE